MLIMDKANAADLSSGVFAILINLTSQISSKMVNSDITKETLNCTLFIDRERVYFISALCAVCVPYG